MIRLLWFLSVLLTAAVAGTASAIYATQTLKPSGMLNIGPWEAVNAVGDTSNDPYTHALIASSGQLPPGSAEGMRFIASVSHDDAVLIPDCTITLSGEVMLARLWTLSLTQANGSALPESETSRLALHSRDIVYNAQGGFDLTIGPRPATINTMLVRSESPISLVLHVYDGAIGSAPDTGLAAMPLISVGRSGPGCAG